MSQLTISKTKDFLILKIPLQSLRERKISLPERERRAILEGLRAYAEGHASKPLYGKAAIAFLRNL